MLVADLRCERFITVADEPSTHGPSSQEEGGQQNNDAANELEELKKKADEYLNGWKRAQADFANYKKDEAKRFEELAKYASESLIRDLLVVFDSFDLARASFGDNEAAKKGVLIMKSQLFSILQKRGLEEIKVKAGVETFNPAFHEAIGEKESDMPQETILEVVEEGFTLYGKVIRPARVIVAK